MIEVPAELTSALAAGLLLFAAGLFASAALHKLRTFTEFTGFMAGYRLLPRVVVPAAAAVIVLAEIVAVAGALSASSLTAFLPGALLLLYAGAMGVNLLRGRRDIDCGCGGTPMPLSWSLVLRNGLLSLAFTWAAASAWAVSNDGLLATLTASPTLLVPIAAFALCLGVLYAAFNQLQSNLAIHRQAWSRST